MWKEAILLLLNLLAVKCSEGFEDYGFQCAGAGKIIPNVMVCDGIPACPPPRWSIDAQHESESADESSTICVSDIKIRTQPLGLSSGSLTSNSVILAWTRPEYSGLAPKKLAGYILTAESTVHSFKTTLEHELTSFNATELKPWTRYDIILRPFYASDASAEQDQRFGRAEALMIRTKAAPPSAPRYLKMASSEVGSVAVAISTPRAWNGQPLGYRYHTDLDPKERSVDVSPAGDDVVVTVQAGARSDFTFYASATCIDELGNELRGPEASLPLSTPQPAPVGLATTVLSLNTALLTWQQHQLPKEFLISLVAWDAYNVSDQLGSGANSTFKVGVSHRYSPSYSFLLKDLSPLQNYNVSVQACSNTGCGSAATTAFSTAASSPPVPEILSAFTTGSDSIAIRVNVPHSEALPYFDGFQVRYCDGDLVCRQIFVRDQDVAVKNLKQDTSYSVEVRTVFKVGSAVVFGPPASVTAWTRSEVPHMPQLNETYYAKGPHVIFLGWDFNTSYVDEFQVNMDNQAWGTCTTGPVACDVTFHSASPHENRVFLRLHDLEPFTNYDVAVRGCSKHGCGPEAWAYVRTEVSEPSEPVGLRAERAGNGEIYLEWNKPRLPAGPLTGYMVTWACPGRGNTTTAVRSTTIVIPDLTRAASSCSFSVAAYNDLENGDRKSVV